MISAHLLRHTLVIERATAGAVDDYNQPSQAFAAVATVAGLVQPKNAREQAQANEAGAVVTDHSIYVLLTTDLKEADRIIYAGATYQIEGIERRAYGSVGHLKANVRRVVA